MQKEKVMLTKQQRDVLLFINSEILEDGICPTYREIGARLKISHESARNMVGALCERGFVRKIPDRRRAIEVLRLPKDAAVEA
jgi:repressor LexA